MEPISADLPTVNLLTRPPVGGRSGQFDWTGRQLGTYRLIRLLAEGGFARVYLGEHVHLNRHAAIKVLHAQLASEELEEFRKEARLVARLRHPHIVSILDFDVQDDTPFLVMEYAPHGTLRQRHPRGSVLSPPTIFSYLKQVASALQYAHEQGLIHRDVKPENMLLGQRDEVLLSDFGIAIAVHSPGSQTAREVVGTITYMAPEQLRGRPCVASDQYALAIVAYEWLCGECPFRGSFVEIGTQHINADPPSLGERVPDLSHELEAVVLKGLSKDPERRYASVLDFVEAFGAAIEAGEQVQGKIGVAPVPLKISMLKRNGDTASDRDDGPEGELEGPRPADIPEAGGRGQDRTGARPSTRSPRPRPLSPPAPCPYISDDPAPAVRDALKRVPTIGVGSPAGSNIEKIHEAVTLQVPAIAATRLERESTPSVHDGKHYVSRRNVLLGIAGITTMGLAGGGITWLVRGFHPRTKLPITPGPTPTPTAIPVGTQLFSYRGHSDAVLAVTWSPDGTYIASGSRDHVVHVWYANSGFDVYTFGTHTDAVNAVAWSADGKSIASGSADKTVQVWAAPGGGIIATFSGHSDAVNSVAWSPDSSAVASGSRDKTVQVWKAGDGSAIYGYSGHADAVNAIAWSPDGTLIASGSSDKTVQVWKAASGELVTTYHGHSDAVLAVAWSADGTYIASGSSDRTVHIWKAASGDGSDAVDYDKHGGPVMAVVWSPTDGTRIASGSADNTVREWSTSDGSNFYTYGEHSEAVNALAWSPNGTTIASGSTDMTVQVWQAI